MEEKEGGRDGVGRFKFNEIAKEKYEVQASKIRAKLFKAKAEIERLKINGKITKNEKRTEWNSRKSAKDCRSQTW